MCGIAGFFDNSGRLNEAQLHKYNDVQFGRGPDGKGILYKSTKIGAVGLAHVRLSILDLSDLGKQPMSYEYLSIVLNGEIYNYKSIQKELTQSGYLFESNSDTEVVLKAFHAWGKACVAKFRGMFAFTIYDSDKDKFYLCRDRVGVKPLYYSLQNGQFVFGSEMKVFFYTKHFQATVDQSSLRSFINNGYVPHPHTMLQGVIKAEVGAWTILDLNSFNLSVQYYWDYAKLYEKEKFAGTFQEAVNETERIAKEACEFRMVSDVPVGVFLSGGFDSTLVTALLQKDRTEKLKTFTIGFSDGLDESKDAERIAKHLGTEHTSYDCQQKDAMYLIPHLPELYDDPIADISCIPTMLVSKLASQEVTVALSADGGDELFGGYDGFKNIPKRLVQLSKIPMSSMVGQVIKSASYFFNGNSNHLQKKALGIGEVLKANKFDKLYQFHIHQSGVPLEILSKVLIDKSPIYLPKQNKINFRDPLDEIYVLGVDDVLRDLLLVKVDRATMGFSLEGREPLLDHQLMEFAATLPFNYKHDSNLSKRPIREIVYQYVPKEIMDRPKVGFDLPIYKWLKEDLSYLIEEYLGERAIKESMVFNPEYVRDLVHKFKNNSLRYNAVIWRLLVFQMWYKRWMATVSE
jgi:asparagine synthase (glutamine-hydrolysing)